MNSNFIRTARAKGLPCATSSSSTLLPAMLPVVSYLGPGVGIITGSVVIETIFGLPVLVSCSSTVPQP